MTDSTPKTQEPAGFAFSELIDILMQVFGVRPKARGTFVARVQQIQKLGLPDGANAGRGIKVRYADWQIADLTLYFDLLNCGVTPAVIANRFRGRTIFGRGAASLFQKQAINGTNDKFCVISFNTFRALGDGEVWSDFEKGPLEFMPLAEILMHNVDSGIVVNVTQRLRAVRRAVEFCYPRKTAKFTFVPGCIER